MKNILPLLLIAVSAGLFYFYIKPQYAKLGELSLEKNRYNEVLDKSVELREIREKLKEKLENFPAEDLEKLEKAFPEGADIVQLVLDLDNIAVKHGITMRDIKTEEIGENTGRRGEQTKPVELYKIVAVTFKFESLYGNFISFLEDIETSLRIMDIVSVKVKPNDKQPLLQNYEVTIHTYWLRDQNV